MKKFDDKTKYIIKGIIVFIIFYSSVYIQYIPIKLFNIDVKTMSNTMTVVLSTFSSLVLFLIFFFIYRKDLKKDFKMFWKNKEEYMDVGIRCWILGLIIMFAVNYILNIILKAGGANNEKVVQTMIKSFPLLMIIDAGILAPFNEEIVFRKTLKDIFKNKWIFITLSFLLFGGAHVINSSKTLIDYLFIIPYGALGASFAYAYYKTNNIFTSTTLHIIHNTILILISILIR
ncbi:MAG: CPBP family intramembrane metalloprotease [Bacilli bacterium]|nr:CPBP family intramembrane metalloprotease [Bacilli bacterium]